MTEQPAVCDTREEQYHLLVLDPTHTRILAARPARSWLLPFLKFRAQMPEALVFRPYLSRLGVDATPIHEALLRDGCGIDGGDGHDSRARHRTSLHRVRSPHVRGDRRSPHVGTDPRSPRRRRRVAHSDPEDRAPHLPRTLSARRRSVRLPRAAPRRPPVDPPSPLPPSASPSPAIGPTIASAASTWSPRSRRRAARCISRAARAAWRTKRS